MNPWDMAKWRQGRRSPWIPPIHGSSDPEDMGTAFEECFFNFPHPQSLVLKLPGTPALK